VSSVSVPNLQRNSTLDGLNVTQHRFRLDWNEPAVAPNHGIPGAAVAIVRERDLRSPVDVAWHKGMKALEQPLLSGIPDRVAGWIRTRSNVEADGGADRGALEDRRASLAVDDTSDGPSRHSARSSDVRVAQACHALGQRDLGQNTPLVVRGYSSRSSDGTVSIGHDRMWGTSLGWRLSERFLLVTSPKRSTARSGRRVSGFHATLGALAARSVVWSAAQPT